MARGGGEAGISRHRSRSFNRVRRKPPCTATERILRPRDASPFPASPWLGPMRRRCGPRVVGPGVVEPGVVGPGVRGDVHSDASLHGAANARSTECAGPDPHDETRMSNRCGLHGRSPCGPNPPILGGSSHAESGAGPDSASTHPSRSLWMRGLPIRGQDSLRPIVQRQRLRGLARCVGAAVHGSSGQGCFG